jgi:hypothetical protein
MTNKDLFKEAIADAKQVREAALANAKVALEEALTPRLQSMLSTRLQEMEDDYSEGEVEAAEEVEDNLEEDFDLSAILAELDAEEVEKGKKEDKEEMKEAEEGEEEEGVEGEEEEGVEGEEEEGVEGEEEEEVEVSDMSVEDLKDLIKDIIAQEMGGDELIDDESDVDDEEIDLGIEDEIMEESEEINLEELLAELESLDEENGDSSDLGEAINTINTLRSELQEVNLLNAKLLYVNKIFKAKNLTESQKVKVIASFDKATTAKEAKIVFESLESTLTAVTSNVKSQIKESLGFASKAAGVAPKKQIVEINETISRMQQLAGIIK